MLEEGKFSIALFLGLSLLVSQYLWTMHFICVPLFVLFCFPSPTGNTGWLEWFGVGYIFSSRQLGPYQLTSFT